MCELVADGNGFRLPIFRPAARVFGTLLAWSTSLGSLRNEPCPSVIVLFGNRSGLFPVRPALPHGPWFEPVSRHHGIRPCELRALCNQPEALSLLQLLRRLLAFLEKVLLPTS